MKRATCQRCGNAPIAAPHLTLCEACLYADAMRAATQPTSAHVVATVTPIRKAEGSS